MPRSSSSFRCRSSPSPRFSSLLPSSELCSSFENRKVRAPGSPDLVRRVCGGSFRPRGNLEQGSRDVGAGEVVATLRTTGDVGNIFATEPQRPSHEPAYRARAVELPKAQQVEDQFEHGAAGGDLPEFFLRQSHKVRRGADRTKTRAALFETFIRDGPQELCAGHVHRDHHATGLDALGTRARDALRLPLFAGRRDISSFFVNFPAAASCDLVRILSHWSPLCCLMKAYHAIFICQNTRRLPSSELGRDFTALLSDFDFQFFTKLRAW